MTNSMFKQIINYLRNHVKQKPYKRLLYRIGLPSNTASPLAPFVRIELLCFCRCIPQQTRIATNTAIDAHIIFSI